MEVRDLKIDFYNFYERHLQRLNLINPQFRMESGDDLKRSFTWFSRASKIEEARFFSEEGEYSDYFDFCINENYYTLQVADGSLVQVYLAAENGIVTNGSMALLPRPGNGFDYFRVDYDPDAARHYRHTGQHVHFGFKGKNMRISAYQFPWPSEFLAFVAHLISDDKGRALLGSEFQVDARICGFDRDRMFPSLDNRGERFNHYFKFHCVDAGGTQSVDLRAEGW